VTGLRVYVASPLGFTEAGRRWHDDVLLPAVRAVDLEPLDPWDHQGDPIGTALAVEDPAARRSALGAANATVAAANAEMIRIAAGMLAVLDGPDVDSGVAAEIGFAAALGRPAVGLRTDWRTAGDNEASIVNLQVEWFLASTGGTIETSLDAALDALCGLVRRPARR
jgi:nucleoside 2-deoxyribosyltransferase